MSRLLGSVCLALALLLLLVAPWGTAALADGQARLFVVDGDEDSQIIELNPSTGAVLNSFATPVTCGGDGPDGLAYCNGRMFFVTSGEGEPEYLAETIYEINPNTGAVINSFPAPPNDGLDALGLSGDRLYALDFTNNTIYVLNPDTGAVITSYTPGAYLMGGGTFAGTRNSLFFTGGDEEEEGDTVYELNPANGAVLNSFSPPGSAANIYGLGFSSSRNTLFLGGSAGIATIYELNPNNGNEINSFPHPEGTFITALAADECVPPPVGGELYLVNKLNILAPWLVLALVLALGVSILVLKRRQAVNS
jgi:outer membrane protein assembly factor BamB